MVFIILKELMYVCVCMAVSKSEVEGVIREGAACVADVTRACRAGGDCGACHGQIEDMIEEQTELVSAAALVRTRAA